MPSLVCALELASPRDTRGDDLVVELFTGVLSAPDLGQRPIGDEREAVQLRSGADGPTLAEPLLPRDLTRLDHPCIEERGEPQGLKPKRFIEPALFVAHVPRVRDLHGLKKARGLCGAPLVNEGDRGAVFEQPLVA